MPAIWQSEDTELDEKISYFLANGNLSPENWDENGRLQILFDTLRKARSPKKRLSILQEGLIPGALKSPRHAQVQAHHLISTLLADMICESDDTTERRDLSSKLFVSILHDFLTEMDDKKIIETGMDNALGIAMAYICRKRPEDFDLIWEREIKSFEMIINVGPKMGKENTSFKRRGTRWIMLASSILKHLSPDTRVHERMTDLAISPFTTSLAHIFTMVCDAETIEAGRWVYGMDFVDMFISAGPLLDCLKNALEMEGARQSLEDFLSPYRMKSFLRSAASASFIRVILRYVCTFGEDGTKVWHILLKEVIPEDGPIGVRNSESLIYKLVSGIKGSMKGSTQCDFQAPEGLHTNLVQEMIKAMNAKDMEPSEETNLMTLFVDLFVLRRRLVSDETALAMVQNLGLDSEDLVPLMTQILVKDPTFAEALLAYRPSESPSQNSNEWSVMGFLMEVCECESQLNPTPLRWEFERALTTHQELLEQLFPDFVDFVTDKALHSSIGYLL